MGNRFPLAREALQRAEASFTVEVTAVEVKDKLLDAFESTALQQQVQEDVDATRANTTAMTNVEQVSVNKAC